MPQSGPWIQSLFVLATLAACERTRPVFVPTITVAPDTSPIWIGEFGSWSGHDARAGLAEHRGFQLAIDAANATGGVRGRPIRVHGYDDQSETLGARSAGERLTKQDKAVLIVGGTTTGRTISAARASSGVPLVSPACVLPSTGDNAWFAIGLEPDLALRLEKLAAHVQAAGLQSVTMLVRPEVGSDRVNAKTFASAAKDRGLDRVNELELTLSDLDATTAKLKTDAPAAIFVACSGADAAGVCAVLQRRGVTSKLLAASPPDVGSLPADQRESLEGVVAASPFDPDARAAPAAEFLAQHAKRLEGAPDESEFLGWLAGNRAIAALTRAHEYWTRDVQAAVAATEGPAVELVIVRVEHGELHTVREPTRP
jgi:branched-chain amino acid transport system substrate-binding protein